MNTNYLSNPLHKSFLKTVTPSTVQGTSALKIQGCGHLVKRDDESGEFKPVDSLEKRVSSEELDAKYGIWTDKEIKKGPFWNKQTVREADGQVQADEVTSFKEFKGSQRHHITLEKKGPTPFQMIDASIEVSGQTPNGPLIMMNTEWLERPQQWNSPW